MSYFLRIFGRSSQPLTRREIASFISAGSFFDLEPRFEPPPEAPESAEENWTVLTLHYDTEKRPVRFERNVGDALLKEEVQELLFVLNRSKPTHAQREVLETIQAATQVISIEVKRETASEDCWEMLDAVEAFLAERCDGVIYAPDDGFFDKSLQPLYRL
jgi:hypothetical protein